MQPSPTSCYGHAATASEVADRPSPQWLVSRPGAREGGRDTRNRERAENG